MTPMEENNGGNRASCTTMRFVWLLLLLLIQHPRACAFVSDSSQKVPKRTRTTTKVARVDPSRNDDEIDKGSKSQLTYAKENLLQMAQALKQKHGMLTFDRKAKADLTSALKDLEILSARAGASDTSGIDSSQLLGDWTLVCSAVSVDNLELPSLPRVLMERVDKRRAELRKHVTIQQRIACSVAGELDQVDNILEIKSPSTTRMPFLVNPLGVETTKLLLRQKANARRSTNTKMKLRSQQLVWNVCGKSRFLAQGRNVARLPIPSFLSLEGDFETTYVDETLRISQGRNGALDQLLVFVRVPESTKQVVQKKQSQEVKGHSTADDGEKVEVDNVKSVQTVPPADSKKTQDKLGVSGVDNADSISPTQPESSPSTAEEERTVGIVHDSEAEMNDASELDDKVDLSQPVLNAREVPENTINTDRVEAPKQPKDLGKDASLPIQENTQEDGAFVEEGLKIVQETREPETVQESPAEINESVRAERNDEEDASQSTTQEVKDEERTQQMPSKKPYFAFFNMTDFSALGTKEESQATPEKDEPPSSPWSMMKRKEGGKGFQKRESSKRVPSRHSREKTRSSKRFARVLKELDDDIQNLEEEIAEALLLAEESLVKEQQHETTEADDTDGRPDGPRNVSP